MENSSKALSGRERRRKQIEEKCESDGNEISVERIETPEKDSISVENSRILLRRGTFTVLKTENAFESTFSNEKDDEISNTRNDNDPESDSNDSKNLTRTINVETWNSESGNLTYDVNDENYVLKLDTYSIRRTESVRPVPAPRRRQTIQSKEQDKNSSDTDRDVMEIEPDDGNSSNRTESPEKIPEVIPRTTIIESDGSVEEPPKPKPRKLSSISNAFPRTESMSKSKSLEEIAVRVVSPRSTKSNPETKRVEHVQSEIREESKTEVKDGNGEGKRKKRRFATLIHRRRDRKAPGMFSSVMKLERARIPTISSILRELKEDPTREKLEEENGIDFEINSPRLPLSAANGKMYVQCKNGFYLTNRDDFFKGKEDSKTGNGVGGRMEDSSTTNMLKTGMFFQKYWSRSMIYVHGVLAGLGFGHAFAVSAIVYYINESGKFLDVYASLALKIHFLFYALISLSVISCLDRLDVGRMSKKHWKGLCVNSPVLWLVLAVYVSSLLLNFANHNAEFEFDNRLHGNGTGDNPEVHEDLASTFSGWYRIVWARDVTVLAGWLLISLTDYPDNLYLYVRDLATHSEDWKLKTVIS